MDAPEWTAEDENVGEWVEYWDENVGASYFYNVKTGEATWTTPAGYQSNTSNQEDTTTEAWPMENGGIYHTLPPRSKHSTELLQQEPTGNQQAESYGDQYAPYGYEYGGDEASQWGYDNNNGGYYYYGDADGSAYPLQQADNGETLSDTEQNDPVDSEYDINYKIYLTQVEREQQDQNNEGAQQDEHDEKLSSEPK